MGSPPKDKREEKSKRNLKCKICGNYIDTIYVGPPELFQCNGCTLLGRGKNMSNRKVWFCFNCFHWLIWQLDENYWKCMCCGIELREKPNE